jgi:predicted DNA-binding WGR domain protein
MRVYLEYHDEDDNSHKFWQADNETTFDPSRPGGLPGDIVWVSWGRIGSNGQKAKPRNFNSVESAEGFITKKTKEKLAKGYVHC